MAGLFHELKRRNVVRVGVAYVVLGWVVVQITQLLFEAFGTPDWVIKTVIVLIGIGFPFALLFAWAFELTPDGLKKTREVDVAASITPKTGQRLNYIIIGALVIALGYFIWERQSYEQSAISPVEPLADVAEKAPAAIETEEPVEAERRSIAVLPFLNMSSDQDQEWFADGLTEEILNSLAKAPDLLVAARTSSFSFKGSSQPVPEIAAALGVDHVLEGSVRRGGETLRITAQLIRAEDGFHLWSETFDRTMEDIISIQEEIAIQIAEALEIAMDPEALAEMMDSGTSSVPAYEAYLTGRGAVLAALRSGDPYIALEALESYEQAVRFDPEFASAWFRIYRFWSTQGATNQLLSGITELSRDEIATRRDDAIDQAIRFEKDPVTLLSYQASESWEHFEYRRAMRLFTEFLSERPNSEEGFAALISLFREFGKHNDVAAMLKDRYENQNFTERMASLMLQSLRLQDDAEFMRIVAQHAMEDFGDDANIVYQAHRQLLWASDIDGAATLVPKIRNSELPEANIFLVELRQACAEKRLQDASSLINDGRQKFAEEPGILWLAEMIMGDKESAHAIFVETDAAGDAYQLSTYLTYTHFDPTLYPSLMEKLAGQGFEDREFINIPYRCNR
jgi:TolB-like protein